MQNLDALFKTAKKCAQVSAEMCRSYKIETTAAHRKVDKTWVTEADEAIEKVLRQIITEAHPDHAILGEEQGGQIGSKGARYTWVLDPIDGTFSFVHGIPFYSSLIAVLEGTTPVIGIACLPGLNIEMSAMKGKGVWINGQPFERSALVGQDTIEIVATADPYRFRMENKQSVLSTLSGEGFKTRTYPDALGYYLLLKGSVRAFVDPKVEVWDVAPFHVILPEAGFRIETWSGDGTLQRGTSVAYPLSPQNKPLHCEDVLKVLRS